MYRRIFLNARRLTTVFILDTWIMPLTLEEQHSAQPTTMLGHQTGKCSGGRCMKYRLQIKQEIKNKIVGTA